MTPPIRFLALVVGGWTIARTVASIPDAQTDAQAPSLPQLPQFAVPRTYTAPGPELAAQNAGSPRLLPLFAAPPASAHRLAAPIAAAVAPVWERVPEAGTRMVAASLPETLAARASVLPETRDDLPTLLPLAQGHVVAAPRWSGGAWLLARGGDEAVVANTGLLGGSQAGTRFLYRMNADVARPVSLSMRVSSPLRRDGVEAAAGVEWQPFAGAPFRVLAERRQRVSGEGRSAFALVVHGGVSEQPVAAGFRLDAYAQAGVVGARSRDLFADVGATLVRPLDPDRPGRLAIGAGAWGGVQPGASRLDVGPRLTTSLAGGRARVSIDWRFRVAGDSAPPSGPSLTVGTDF